MPRACPSSAGPRLDCMPGGARARSCASTSGGMTATFASASAWCRAETRLHRNIPGARDMEYETVILERKGAVAIVTLNRPEALNALSAALIRDLGAALDALENDDAIGAIVITGSDKAFAAGADIKEMASRT